MADREFIGEKWFKYLKNNGINFNIRIKKDAKTTNSQGQEVQVKNLFLHLKPAESFTIEDPRLITGVPVYLTALRLSDGEFLIVASSKNDGQNALEYYKERWQIETLFSCLKSRGFNLEETRVTDLERIKKLLIVPVIAFCWSYRTGEWQHDLVKPITVKNIFDFLKVFLESVWILSVIFYSTPHLLVILLNCFNFLILIIFTLQANFCHVQSIFCYEHRI
ncbi:MAG: transposase [Candidatus Competibacteraceae bacterium]|nr:transposase [Candidatus Competibacteraceae bacterium]